MMCYSPRRVLKGQMALVIFFHEEMQRFSFFLTFYYFFVEIIEHSCSWVKVTRLITWTQSWTHTMYKKNTFQSLLCKNIRRAWVSRSMTIEQLAHDANMTYSQISRIELGKINTSVYTLHILCQTLDVGPMELLDFTVQGSR